MACNKLHSWSTTEVIMKLQIKYQKLHCMMRVVMPNNSLLAHKKFTYCVQLINGTSLFDTNEIR